MLLLLSACRMCLVLLRSLLVWVSDLVIFYVITNGDFGEAWNWSSWLQLLGFSVLVLGTVVYNYTTLYVEAHFEELQQQYPPDSQEVLGLTGSHRASHTSMHSGRSGASKSSRASNRSIGTDRVLQTRF